jgi:hypothetical protein
VTCRDWAGWFSYDPAYEAKRVSDLTAPLPPVLSMLLARMAQANLGAMLGMPDSVADLSLHGGGLFAYPRGSGLGRHQDADVHPRLGLARAWSAVLFVHPSWGGDWGGELEFAGVPPLARRRRTPSPRCAAPRVASGVAWPSSATWRPPARARGRGPPSRTPAPPRAD